MRNASIDIKAANEKNILVCGTQSLKRPPMELAWSMILGLSRHIYPEYTSFRERGPWQSTVGCSLQGKTLGLVGLGHIGQLMVPVAKAFEMNVIAWSPNLTQARCEEAGVVFSATKESLFQQADIVSIHLVLSEFTRHLITRRELELMKHDALLINTSRAELVDQQDMINILREKKIGGAGLDVFDEEPLPEDHDLRSLDNIIATPHLGYVADTNYELYFTQAVENIQAYQADKPIRILKI